MQRMHRLAHKNNNSFSSSKRFSISTSSVSPLLSSGLLWLVTWL